MTYALSSAGLWVNRANQAYGSSRQYGVGSSFETDLANMTADRNNWQASSNTWQGRANNAWGSSRVWNTGSSFEQDSATWHGRADQAWGSSRVWNTGESWEAAYNRVLPPAGVIHLQYSGAVPKAGTWVNIASCVNVHPDRNGYWLIYAWMQNTPEFTGARILLNGSGISGNGAFGSTNNGSPVAATSWLGQLTTGDQVTAQGYTSNNYASNGGLDLYFIPTQANPH